MPRRRFRRRSSRSYAWFAPRAFGVYFVTQNPLDVPELVLGSSATAIQHAAPRVHAARPEGGQVRRRDANARNPKIDVEKAIWGASAWVKALVFVARRARATRRGRAREDLPATQQDRADLGGTERREIVKRSVLYGHYETGRGSRIGVRKSSAAVQKPRPRRAPAPREAGERPRRLATSSVLQDVLFGSTGPRGGHRDGLVQAAAKSAARTVGNQLGRQILRGVLGSILGGNAVTASRRLWVFAQSPRSSEGAGRCRALYRA